MKTDGLRIDPHRIELIVRMGPRVRGLEMDPTHMSVAVKSLLKNSIESIRSSERGRPSEATEPNGQIELRVDCDVLGNVSFTVTDNGDGVSAAAREHLFDPFYSGREAGRGLGFGLSKAWRIAELHGGELRLEEMPTRGARFVLQIPPAHAFSFPLTTAVSAVVPGNDGPAGVSSAAEDRPRLKVVGR